MSLCNILPFQIFSRNTPALHDAKAAASWVHLVPFCFSLCAEHIPYSCVSSGVKGRLYRGCGGREAVSRCTLVSVHYWQEPRGFVFTTKNSLLLLSFGEIFNKSRGQRLSTGKAFLVWCCCCC